MAWYVAAGILGVILGIALDGPRGLQATALAWLICLIGFLRPPRNPRVAAIPLGSKISRERRVLWGAMPLRMLLVLTTAAVLYRQLDDRLGVGFWIALVVFYPLVLLISVTRTLADLKRPD